MTPELRQLRYFVAVAEAGGLTRAARRLHISQQSLSSQISSLENQLDVALFTRSHSGVELTYAGTVLQREATQLLAHADEAMAAVARVGRGEQGELHVGFLSSVSNYLIPPVLRAFAARHPDVELHTHEVKIAELVDGLRSGRLDAGLTRPPLVDDLDTEVILREPVAAVLADDHPLSGRAELTLADLEDEPWVLTPRTSWPPWHRKYDEDFARAGYRPRVVRRGDSPQNLLALVAAGVGVTRLPVSARTLRDSGVTFVRLVGEESLVVLAWRPDTRNPALAALREVVRAMADQIDPATGG